MMRKRNLNPLRLLRYIAAVLLFMGPSAAIIYNAQPAAAASTICYFTLYDDDNWADVVDCNGAQGLYRRMAQQLLGHDLINSDKCYEIGGISIFEYNLGSPQCNSLASKAQNAATTPPKCWHLEGNISDLDTANFDAGRIINNEVECTPDLQEKLQISSFENGFCYVYDDDFEVRSMGCHDLFMTILQANYNAEISSGVAGLPTNAERDAVAECDGSGFQDDPQKLQECLEGNPIVSVTVWAINLLSAGAGLVITFMIIVGGIQYSTSGANPQAVTAAKNKLFNAIIALLMLIFLYSFLQWLVPGGPF
jgi:hypothetical protein